MGTAGIGTAVTLYPVVKRQNEGVALGFVTARVLEAVMIFTGVISLLSLLTLRQDLGGTAGPTSSRARPPPPRAHVAVYNWTFLLGQSLMPAINALLLGSLMYRSRLVPRIIPTLRLHAARPFFVRLRHHHPVPPRPRDPPVLALGFLPVAAWSAPSGSGWSSEARSPPPSPPQ